MTIDIAISASKVEAHEVVNKTLIVVDVLRATTVITTGLEHGALEIIPVLSVEDAEGISSNTNNCLKAGERNADKIEGFDLGNSPLEYTPDVVKGKSIVLTTTNGTKALLKTNGAAHVLIGSFINLSATVKAAANTRNDILILCSGTNGALSLDDALCAGAMVNELLETSEYTLSDSAWMHQELYINNTNLHACLSACKHYRLLQEKGMQDDLDYCIKLNTSSMVPFWNGKNIRI